MYIYTYMQEYIYMYIFMYIEHTYSVLEVQIFVFKNRDNKNVKSFRYQCYWRPSIDTFISQKANF